MAVRKKPTIQSQDALVTLCEQKQAAIQSLQSQLKDEVDQNAALRRAVNTARDELKEMTEARDCAVDTIRHLERSLRDQQSSATFWKGVACGMNPEIAAKAHASKHGRTSGAASAAEMAGTDQAPALLRR